MRLIQAIVLSVFVFFGSATVRADSHHDDPRIIIGSGTGQAGPDPPIIIGGQILVPVDQQNGGGIVHFTNDTTDDVVQLGFLTPPLPKNDTVTCASESFFGECTPYLLIGTKAPNEWSIIFTDPLNGGIPPGAEFFVDLNNAGENAGGWKGVKVIFGRAIFKPVLPVPEPSTFLFLLVGLGSISLRGWRRS
jgi:hypothetical protein